MAQAWYRDDSLGDPQSEHHLNPPQYISIDDLYSRTGVEYWKIDMDNLQTDENFKNIRKIRGYDFEDHMEVSRETIPDYDEATKMFYTEHEHEEDNVRLFTDGTGYFDVRDKNDRWIRIKVGRGVLLVLPGWTYHRFTPGANNYTKVMRLYSSSHVWKTIERREDSKP
ncbi:uncharacterized protein [Parasteatoda tepidariorum]|uniref:uncharacterized protein n=1 Tax=Parasteatoda tepidariorum TaxID=114398 RepID=UPI001C729AAC|nr:1,2-dihydroxy-3-keto-5-methylthiopentene dioxygenase 3-like [Parasteatoda tepidariorum]